ncbi:retrovirus-related pol polyprotein from transposon TNT 1-94, partial [Tanacetum coccineum]
SGKVKVINGSMVVLTGICRDNSVYSLDGHAVAGELNATVEEKTVLPKLWGSSQVESLGGKRYFLSIVDDYSSRVWVYILMFKHEAFGKFKEWKQLVENQTRRTVKKLRMNNGLEFCNQNFEQLCIESGIAIHLTVAGTPQQNKLAERMNITLMDSVRCLLIQSGLPKTFWAEETVHVEQEKITAIQSWPVPTFVKEVRGFIWLTRDPHPLPPYVAGETKNENLEHQLIERDDMLKLLQKGDYVFLKIQPYRQKTLAKRPYEKLSPRFYDPYRILRKVGMVAYKLELPPDARIHPVFHRWLTVG